MLHIDFHLKLTYIHFWGKFKLWSKETGTKLLQHGNIYLVQVWELNISIDHKTVYINYCMQYYNCICHVNITLTWQETITQ